MPGADWRLPMLLAGGALRLKKSRDWRREAAPRPKLTPRTVTDLPAIRRRLEATRRAGYVVVDQEITSGLRALAAPILDIDGHPIGAVSVVAPVLRMPADAFVARTAAPVVDAARTIAKAIQAGGAIAAQAAA